MKNKMRMILIGLIAATLTMSGCGAKSRSDDSIAAPMETAKSEKTIYTEKADADADAYAYEEGEEIGEAMKKEGAADFNTEEYSAISESPFLKVQTSPLSTFSVDVDTASYSNVRRFINDGMLPDIGAVRTEELVNYFNYDYELPKGGEPFSGSMQIGICPWNEEHYLAMVGLKGKEVKKDKLPKSNLVFLLDVSGSMDEPNKLPLLKEAFKLLVDELTENDRVSIVVYAGASGTVLEGARGDEKARVMNALERLNAGGSTAGAEGIELAYQLAKKNFISGGNNRIILATDGDFNVGVSSESELEKLIEKKRDDGIFLSVIGFGTGNIKDNKMETLADKGNGNYAYIDSIKEAEKVFVKEMSGTLLTIAKDVKLQVEFNPQYVESYRLIGYENRKLNNEDFEDDTKDAGEIGAGHTVTALYEIVPAKGGMDENKLRYSNSENKGIANEIMFLKVRYKEPDASESQQMTFVLKEDNFGKTNKDFLFAAAVAEFGLLLCNSENKGNASYDQVIQKAKNAVGNDEGGYRKEFVELVREARRLSD